MYFYFLRHWSRWLRIGTKLTNSVELSTTLEAIRCAATRYIPSIFMEPEGSLPSSQGLSTCTYPGLDQSSPLRSILSLKGPS
jgi:hypothetical protein